MNRFDYLAKKISDASFETVPFRHVYLEDFFSAEDFAEIVAAQEIDLPPSDDDHALFDLLYDRGYKMVEFPGCITNRDDYIAWHGGKKTGQHVHTACEGFGVTLRLQSARTPILQELMTFLSSDLFNRTIAEKFSLDLGECNIDNGIQKYLDGYEISPHPDIRRKAATFMVNINPHDDAESLDHHTHYLRFKERYTQIEDYWEKHPEVDRCWVPWDWCEDVKTQPKNNSIVLFSPDNTTMHAVRARYNHLLAQRTQLYGNLWFKHTADLASRDWEHFAMDVGEVSMGGVRRKVLDALPKPVYGMLQKVKGAIKEKHSVKSDDVADRTF